MSKAQDPLGLAKKLDAHAAWLQQRSPVGVSLGKSCGHGQPDADVKGKSKAQDCLALTQRFDAIVADLASVEDIARRIDDERDMAMIMQRTSAVSERLSNIATSVFARLDKGVPA